MTSPELVKQRIKEKTGIDVDHVDHDCVILGSISMAEFGIIGCLTIYRDQTGMVRAAPVPFGLTVGLAA